MATVANNTTAVMEDGSGRQSALGGGGGGLGSKFTVLSIVLSIVVMVVYAHDDHVKMREHIVREKGNISSVDIPVTNGSDENIPKTQNRLPTNMPVAKSETIVPDKRDISFTHIPKVAGTSFNREVNPRLTQQNCYDYMKKPNMINVVFFRDPRNHVQSQFLYCKHNTDWARKKIKGTDFPLNDDDVTDFRTWLQHFVAFLEPGNRKFGSKHDYNCIDPREVQARHMSCHKEPNPRANHALAVDPNITHAIENLHDATLIGVSNFYHESICMLRLRQKGTLPDACHCNATESTGSEHVAVAHGVPKHSADDLPPDMIAMIDSLTKLDR
eukprot:scaffold20597_cov167-Amphora_coffeaeformis.AAC.1